MKRFLAVVIIFVVALLIWFWRKPVKENDITTSIIVKTGSAPVLPVISDESKKVLLKINEVSATTTVKSLTESECMQKLMTEAKNNTLYAEKLQKEIYESFRGLAPVWFLSDSAPFTAPTASSSPSEKFISALAYSHMFYGLKQQAPLDYNKALLLLEDVHLSDPKNSAPLAVMAVIYNELKNKNLVYSTLQKIKNSTEYFNSFELDINRRFHRSIKTPADYFLVIQILYDRALLNYQPLLKIMKEYNTDYLAKQLVAPALKEGNVSPDFDWSLVAYGTGAAVLNKLNPNQKYLTTSKMLEYKMNASSLRELYPVNFENNCRMEEIEPYIAGIQKLLSRSED